MHGETEWRTVYENYEMSRAGLLRNKKTLQHILPNARRDRKPSYEVRVGSHIIQRRMEDIFQLCYGVKVTFTYERADEMREEAKLANELRKKWIDSRKGTVDRITRENEIKKAVGAKQSEISMPPMKSDCPFPQLKSLVTEYPTFDDPQIDPFGCGTWWVRLVMAEDEKQTAKRAA